MLYIAENLKLFRKGKDLTQEAVAELLGVSPQSVSKWERGETYPDITLLPALANLYKTSIDALIGMDKINDNQAKSKIFDTSREHLRQGNYNEAIKVLSEALRIFPNDEGFLLELAVALALDGDTGKLKQAVTLCERVLSGDTSGRVHHTTRAALCFIYLKAGYNEKAVTAAENLPNIRESRETVLKQLKNESNKDKIEEYLKFIAIGDSDQQDIITVDFGVNMVPICYEYNLAGKIEVLRREIDAPNTNDGHRKLPMIRAKDNASLAPNQVRVRYYSNYLIDREYEECNDAVEEIVKVLRDIAQ